MTLPSHQLDQLEELDEQQSDSIPFLPLPPSFHHNQHDTQPPHLTQYTYDDYIQLSDSIKENHDLVSGYLLYNPKMSDVDHIDIVKSITYYLIKSMVNEQKHLYVYSEAQIYIPSRQRALQNYFQSTSTSHQHLSSPSSSNSSSKSGEGKRRSDICVFTSSPKIGPDGYFEKDTIPIMIIEVTSETSSRKKDFELNWRQYYRAGVEEYVIIDRDKTHQNTIHHRPCVVVGKRSESLWPRTSTGYPSEILKRSLKTRGSGSSDLRYHHCVYEENDEAIVKCSFLKLKAKQMLFPPRMEVLYECDQKRSIEREQLLREELKSKDEELKFGKKELKSKDEELKFSKKELKSKDDEILKMKDELKRMRNQLNGNGSPPRKVLDKKSSPRGTP